MNQLEINDLKRAKEALAASEARLSLVLKGSNDGWWDWDLVSNQLFYSPRWWGMLGYAPDELPNDAALWQRLLHPDDAAHTDLVFRSALDHGPDHYEVEFRLLHKRGHYVPLLSRGHILRDAAGRPLRVSGTNTDLTARKAAERAQREGEASQRALMESMADGVFVAQDGCFVFANPALPAMLGWAPDEFVGLDFAAVIHADSLALWNERYALRVGDGPEPTSHYEVALRHRDGRTVWVELRASRVDYRGRRGVLGILRDVSERRRADAELLAARQLAQDTLDGLTAHICVLDEQGRIVSVNKAWRTFGADQGALPERIGEGMNYLDICAAGEALGAAEAAGFDRSLREVLTGMRQGFETQYPCQTRHGLRWFLARVTRSADAESVRVIVAHEDITAQVQAEHRIAILHERLSLAIRGAGYGVWEYDIGSGQLSWDEQMHRLYGRPRDDAPRTRDGVRSQVHPDDLATVDARFADMMAGHRVDYFEFRIRRANDGAVRHVEGNGYLQRDPEGRPQRLVGMNRDITEQIEAEAALRDSEQRWKFALEGAGDGVWDWDVASGQVHYSQRWLEMLGYAEGELSSHYKVWLELVHPDDAPQVSAAFVAHLNGSTDGFAFELRARCKDGSWKWVLSRGIVTARTAAGRALRVVGTHTDLTERKQAEQRRAELEVQLREAQKMEAIGTLAGGVAHDFNNVLAGILGNVELVRQDLGSAHPALANLEQIQRASLRARSLVQQILAFSRRQPQLLASQALRPVVEESLKLLRATLPGAVRLEARLPDTPLHALADATQIQQVLMNLCTNGWHALQGSSGRIEVGLAAASFETADEAPAGLPPGPYARLWVSDTGCGMDAAAIERIFEPFYTTKPVGQGTGLGLAVVHGIVAAHGGAIAVDSEPGRGSSFHLYLPLVEPPAEVALVAGASARLPSGDGQHVLYVDDDELMVVTVQSLLQRAGYRVSTHTDGRAAVAAVAAEPEAFDLVVTDFNMPGYSGIEVARELSQLLPDLPVLISSGYISEDLRNQARSLGVRGLLNKENTVEELGALVHHVLVRGAAPPR